MTPTPTPAPRIAPAPFIPAPSTTTPEGNRIVLTVTLVETVTAVDGKHRMLMGRDGEGALHIFELDAAITALPKKDQKVTVTWKKVEDRENNLATKIE